MWIVKQKIKVIYVLKRGLNTLSLSPGWFFSASSSFFRRHDAAADTDDKLVTSAATVAAKFLVTVKRQIEIGLITTKTRV